MNTLLSQMLSIIMAVCLLTALPLTAASGTWIGGSGNWSDPANWAGGIIADGANEIAAFSPTAPAAIHVTVDTARTIGHIRNNGTGQLHIYGPATLTLQASPKPTITNASTGITFIKVPLAGTSAFAKYGTAARVVMWNNVTHTMTGNIRVDEGELRLDTAGETIPTVGQIYVAGANAAARLHMTADGDPMSVYPCTFRLSGRNGLTSGPQAAHGPLFAYGNRIEAAVSNILLDTYIDAVTRIGQFGIGGKIEFRGNISGSNSYLELYVDGVKTNDFYGSNTYGQATWVLLYSTNSLAVLNIRGPQRLPKNQFHATLLPGAECVIDLHGYRNDMTYNHITDGTLRFKSSTPGGAWWIDFYPNFALVLNSTNKLIVDSGANVIVLGHIVNRHESEILVTNGGFLYSALELLQGFDPGTKSYVTVADGGHAKPFVLRAAANDSGIVNVEPGGQLSIAAAWTDTSIYYGTINLNGGVLADWDDNDWGGSGSANWIQGNINLIVKAGGARIKVDHPNGRVLQKVLQDGGGGGGLTKLGSGVLTLTANNTYTGNTTIESGKLKITTQGAIPAASPIIEVKAGATCDVSSITAFNVANAQTLKGDGLVVGNVNLQSGSFLKPGASVGTLTISGDLATEAGSVVEWEKGPGVDNTDKTVIGGNLIVANVTTVKVVRLSGATPDGLGVTNQVFLVSGSLVGFNNLVLDMSSAPGFTGDLVQIGNSVGVVLVPEPAAALLIGAMAFLGLRRRG